MRDENRAVGFAKEQGYDNAKYITDWNGYHVYEPILEWVEQSNEPVSIGFPLVVLEKDGIMRMSTDDESLEFLSYAHKKRLHRK